MHLTRSGRFATTDTNVFCINAFVAVSEIIVVQCIQGCVSCQPVVCSNKNKM